MKKTPIVIVIVSVLFIITGISGLWSHVKDFSNTNLNSYELIMATALRLLAIVCGVLLFFGRQWGRWLAIFWVFCHIVISVFNSATEVVAHLFILLLVSVLLFQPKVNAFLKKK